MAKSRASRADVQERVAEVLRIRLDAAQFHDVVEYAREKGWNVSERQVGRYIAEADKLLAERMERNRGRAIARHIAQREALAARAINAADYRTALAVLDSTAKLQNLFASERDMRELLKLARVQEERIRELEARLNAAAPTPGPDQPELPPAGSPEQVDSGQPDRPANPLP